MTPKAESYGKELRHLACLSVDRVIAQPAERVMTGEVDEAVVGSPQSGFVLINARQFRTKACKEI